MTWAPESIKLPIATPGQMNPFNQALSSGLDTYNNLMNARLNPQMTMANIEAKKAYAENVGRQMIATVLSNPYAVLKMGPDQLKSLIGQMTAGGSALANPSQDKPAGGFLHNLATSLGLTNSDNASTPADNASTTSSNNKTPISNAGSTSDMNSGMRFDKNGNNIVASDEEINNAANRGDQNSGANPSQAPVTPPVQNATPQTPAAPAGGLSTDDAWIAQNFKGTPQGLAAENRIAAAHASGTAAAEAYQKYKTQTFDNSKAAMNTLNDLEDFHNNYKEASVKGPLTKLPIVDALAQLDPNYQDAVNDMNNLVLNQAPIMLAGGKQTNLGRQMVQKAKIEPGLGPSAEAHVHDKQKLILSRIAQNAEFMNTMENKYGIKDSNQQQYDWLEYNLKYRIVDKDGLRKDNLNKMSEYFKDKYGAGANTGGSSNNPYAGLRVRKWNQKTQSLEP